MGMHTGNNKHNMSLAKEPTECAAKDIDDAMYKERSISFEPALLIHQADQLLYFYLST